MSYQASSSGPLTPIPANAMLPGKLPSPNDVANISQLVEYNQAQRKEATISPSLYAQQSVHLSRSVTPMSQAAASHLSSPPPTVGTFAKATTRDVLAISDDRIQQASSDDLRAIIADLMPALQEARTDAAHYRLQYQMLTIESAEAVERIQVEMDMAQRELEVLQAAEQQQQQLHQQQQQQQQRQQNDVVNVVPVSPVIDPSVRSVHVDLYNAMTNEIQDLKSRNLHNESVVAQQKRMIVQQESEIASMNDRILLLRERLQENRDHRNRCRAESVAPELTPRSERSTPYRTAPSRPALAYSREQRPFAALLHATDLMSNDAPSMPTTPKRKRGYAPSMPITPKTVQPRASHTVYQTPQSSRHGHMKVPMSAPPPRIGSFTDRMAAARDTQRDTYSDGTVSASDDSEAETEVPDEEIQESQTTLLASELLRTPIRPGAQAQRIANAALPLTQGKLFGHVKKSGVHRDDEERQAKRSRAGEGLGYGVSGFEQA